MRATTLRGTRYVFPDLKSLMAKASPLRSGDCLAGVAAENATERVAAQMALADLPISTFLREAVVPYEDDDVTRLIIDRHDRSALAPLAHLTIGGFRDWLRRRQANLRRLPRGSPRKWLRRLARFAETRT
jgi:ethanolamine ammonia-lyase large subunit